MADKKLKTINMILIGCGDEPASLTAADTVEKPIASYALEDFKAERYMDFERRGTEYLVPFHAVDHIIITEATESVEDKPNPYGCEAEGGDKTYTIKWHDGGGEPMFPDTTNVKIGDMVVAPYHSEQGFACDWLNNARNVYADSSEQDRTFEFTEEIANTATDYVVVFNLQCQA